MADLETLRDPAASASAVAEAQARLRSVQEDAGERRRKLVRQLEMADEFIGLLARELR
jgi:hypothetical protein